jgi:asparagine synthase (glutamine-hydrolysing)
MELRCPMLDTALVEYAFTLSSRTKIKRGLKSILKTAFTRDLTPEVLTAPKQGFAIPVGLWMNQEWNQLYRRYAARAGSLSRAYFNKSYIDRLMAEHALRRNDHGRKLFSLLALEIWAERYLGAA